MQLSSCLFNSFLALSLILSLVSNSSINYYLKNPILQKCHQGSPICRPIPSAYSHHNYETLLLINLVGQSFLLLVHAFDPDPLVQFPNWLRSDEKKKSLCCMPRLIGSDRAFFVSSKFVDTFQPCTPSSNKTRCSLDDLFSVTFPKVKPLFRIKGQDGVQINRG